MREKDVYLVDEAVEDLNEGRALHGIQEARAGDFILDFLRGFSSIS